jgi:hypothetical protein
VEAAAAWLWQLGGGGGGQLGGGGGSLAEARQQCCRSASQRAATAAEVAAVAALPKALPLPTKSRFRGISGRQVSFHIQRN